MFTAGDFSKKQVVFVFASDGERLSFSNDNMIVKTADGETKLQCTCYRLFIVYIIGHCSITSVLIQKARKFGFFIAFFSTGFRLYDLIGAHKEGNTMLKRKQYEYSSIDIPSWIVNNKISMQKTMLKKIRSREIEKSNVFEKLDEYLIKSKNVENLNQLLAYEGLASKIYFKHMFSNINWKGRQPRIKRDSVNSVLDIGYTLLFSFVESIVASYGFDTYCGVYHRQFYMRKSLICDLVEPFRPYIDYAVRKAYNLKQIKEEDFIIVNHKYVLKWEKSKKYVGFLMIPLMDNREIILKFIQGYYRCFMKGSHITDYPNLKEVNI